MTVSFNSHYFCISLLPIITDFLVMVTFLKVFAIVIVFIFSVFLVEKGLQKLPKLI